MAKIEYIPFIPTREIVFFPGSVIPIIIGREFSKKAIEESIEKYDGKLILSTQKNSLLEEVYDINDVDDIGVVAKIIQIIKLPDSTYKVLIEGEDRIKLSKIIFDKKQFFKASYSIYNIEKIENVNVSKMKLYLEKQINTINNLNGNLIPDDLIKNIFEISPFETLMYTIATNIDIKESDRKSILIANNVNEIFDILTKVLKVKIELDKIDRSVETRVKKNIEENQKQYYIREKIKGLYSELGDDNSQDEIDNLSELINKRDLPIELKEKLKKEISRLKKLNDLSAESGVIRTYIDTVLELPWEKEKNIDIDIIKAEKILNEEHFGLEKVKNAILEYLAVSQINKNNDRKMPTILCLIGPPGVGKTSFAVSISKAINRKFERISLGGLNDESEIRGHRRTYVGAMPGKIIDALKKCKVNNPVILLDEIDKLTSNFKGDPASALLEVLDPAQNKSFKDNYIDYEFDLSNAFFICTANDYSGIPTPLLDRMEIINLESYTINEKLLIAKNYLIKQVMNETSINDINLSDNVILEIINKYTSEAGVRNLKREIYKIFRKVALKKLKNPSAKYKITVKNIIDYLGVEKFKKDKMKKKKEKLGVVKGLAWTMVGGTTLDVEAVKMIGKGNVKFTGQLGNVMKESAEVAFSYVRSVYDKLSIKNEKFYENTDIHIHFPEGATPKDGPSAGITITTAIVSVLSNRKVRQDIAMTGEITVTGEVLPVGGIKEKVLGAHRIGIKEIVLPIDNKNDTKNLPNEILSEIIIHYVTKYTDVEKLVFSD